MVGIIAATKCLLGFLSQTFIRCHWYCPFTHSNLWIKFSLLSIPPPMTTKSLSNLTNDEALIHSSNDGPTNTNVSSLSFQNSQYKFIIKVLIIINFTVVISLQQQNGDIERLSLTKTQYSFEGTKCLLLVHLSCFSRVTPGTLNMVECMIICDIVWPNTFLTQWCIEIWTFCNVTKVDIFEMF